jgi:hypothetical protein
VVWQKDLYPQNLYPIIRTSTLRNCGIAEC